MTISPCSQSGEVGNFSMCKDERGPRGHWTFTGSLTVQPRKISYCDLLQMTRDTFGAVAERPSIGIRYLCKHCDFSALMQTDDAKEAEVPVRGFHSVTQLHLDNTWDTHRV